jgi:hypothetical protein
MNAFVLELNRASSNNVPPLIPQSQTSVSFGDQPANSSGCPTFTDALASVQAVAAEPRNGTSSSPTLTQPLQIGISTASPLAPAASASLPAQALISLVNKVVYRQPQVSAKADKASPLPSGGGAETKSKPRKETGTADSQATAGSADATALGEVSQSAAGSTAASLDPAATQSEESMPASQGISRLKTVAANAGLAFAMKIQANTTADTGATQPLTKTPSQLGQGQPDQVQPDQEVSASAGAFAAQLAGTTALTATKASGNVDAKTDTAAFTSLPVAGSQNSSSAFTNATSKAAVAAGAPVAEVAPLPSVSGQSLKTVQVQITGADNQTVDLRLMEKSGALTMSVRSSDGTLTRALQQHLPDLTSKLSDQQLRTEWWRPDVQKLDSSQKQSSSSDSNDGAASQDKGNQDKGNSGQQGGRNTDEPDWLEELTNLRKSNQNGTQYSWHL